MRTLKLFLTLSILISTQAYANPFVVSDAIRGLVSMVVMIGKTSKPLDEMVDIAERAGANVLKLRWTPKMGDSLSLVLAEKDSVKFGVLLPSASEKATGDLRFFMSYKNPAKKLGLAGEYQATLYMTNRAYAALLQKEGLVSVGNKDAFAVLIDALGSPQIYNKGMSTGVLDANAGGNVVQIFNLPKDTIPETMVNLILELASSSARIL